MMLAYPVLLEPDDNETFLVTSPDFPELVTFGFDRNEAISRAIDALEEAIAARMYDGKDIPRPSRGVDYATLSTPIAAKALLYQSMRDRGVDKADPAHSLGGSLAGVTRTKDLNHRLWLDEWTPRLGPWAAGRL